MSVRIPIRTLSVLLVASLFVLGAAASATGRHTRAGNRDAARRDAPALLARLSLPPGATASRTAPAGGGAALTQQAFAPATPNLVDDHAWWVVRQPPDAVLAYLAAHAPRWSRPGLTGTTSQNGQTTSWMRGFEWRPVQRVLSVRWLAVALAPLPDGSTGVRADAEVVWITPRPASTRIPAGVRRLQVTTASLPSQPGSGQPATRDWTFTQRKRVKRVIRLLDSLPVAQPGTSSCPVDTGQQIRLAMYGRSGRRPLAVALVDTGGCGGVHLTLHRRRRVELAGTWFAGSGLRKHPSLKDQLARDLRVQLGFDRG